MNEPERMVQTEAAAPQGQAPAEKVPLLEVKDLRTYFIYKHETVKAVDGVSFTVNQQETFGLVGESGCGKSMTCRSIFGLVKKPGKVVGGDVIFEGESLLKKSEKELRAIRGKEMGMIFQEPMTALNPLLKVKDQIMDALDPKVYPTKEKRMARALEMLKLVGIPEPEARLEEYPHQFSGGMRQRVMIAIALSGGLKLVLADEPTTALDVTIQDQVMKLINRLRDQLKMSVILVTHDLGVVAQMCDRVAVMYAGHIVEMTDTRTLFTTPRHPYTYALMNALPTGKETSKRLPTIEGAPPNLANLPPGCPFAERCSLATDECRQTRPELSPYRGREDHLVACHIRDERTEFVGINGKKTEVAEG